MAGYQPTQARADNGRWSRTGKNRVGRVFVKRAVGRIGKVLGKERFTHLVKPGSRADFGVRIAAAASLGGMAGATLGLPAALLTPFYGARSGTQFAKSYFRRAARRHRH